MLNLYACIMHVSPLSKCEFRCTYIYFWIEIYEVPLTVYILPTCMMNVFLFTISAQPAILGYFLIGLTKHWRKSKHNINTTWIVYHTKKKCLGLFCNSHWLSLILLLLNTAHFGWDHLNPFVWLCKWIINVDNWLNQLWTTCFSFLVWEVSI